MINDKNKQKKEDENKKLKKRRTPRKSNIRKIKRGLKLGAKRWNKKNEECREKRKDIPMEARLVGWVEVRNPTREN